MNDTSSVDWRRRTPAFSVPETAVRRLGLRALPAQSAAGSPTLYAAGRLLVGARPGQDTPSVAGLRKVAGELGKIGRAHV